MEHHTVLKLGHSAPALERLQIRSPVGVSVLLHVGTN